MDNTLDIFDVPFRMPSGKKIIFEITATIIPIEIHFIQSKIQLSSFNLVENITPSDLQKNVAIADSIIAKKIFSSLTIFKPKNKKT